jgi:3-oxoacyl-[acyl-carrier protein] reductase
MEPLHEKTVVVAGGTGRVGSHIVTQLLDHGASVVVPSRSAAKLAELRELLRSRLGPVELARLRTLAIHRREQGVASLAARVEAEHGPPWSVVAALAAFRPGTPLMDAAPSQLRQILEGHLLAHFVFARAFLPRLRLPGSKYVFVNGPLAFDPGPGCALGLVATATAGQHIVFRALADELEQSPAKLLELVVHASVRDGETQSGGGISGEDIGAWTVRLLCDVEPARHGQSIHLRSPLPGALPVH